ncbi:unnamed protein product [Meloidogyne enterolobii]|uniref:Uncharacterized protein n=1 Tax=Meloidogyne enterolobii TaxID=390850 RepID=A0ACB0ZXE7_MELEN
MQFSVEYSYMGTPQHTAGPTYRRAITSFRIVESGTPWYGSMRLDELNRTIPERPKLDNSEQSYSSAVGFLAVG